MAMLPRVRSRSAIWVAVEALGGSVLSSVGLLIIASCIGPRDLGLSAIVLGIVQTVNYFPETLFHDAIIQRRRLSSRHVGSAFWSVCLLAVILGGGIAACAYPAGRLYGEPDLSPLLLVLSVSTIPTAVACIQTARLRRAMRFQSLAMVTVASRALSTVAGLALALAGYGPWAIIAQYGLGSVILAVLLVGTTRWRFVRRFSFPHAREIGVFACTRTAAHFVDVTRGRLFFTLLGNYLSLQVLGEVNLAFRLVDSIATVISTTIGRFYLPTFSRLQSDVRVVASSLFGASRTTAVILMPLFCVLALTGNDLVHLFAAAKWQDMQGLIPWLSVAGLAVILGTPANAAILAVGRPLLLAIAAGGVFGTLIIEILIVGPTTGTQAVICWMMPLAATLPITLVITRYALGLGIRAQVVSLIPALLLTGIVMGVAVAAAHVLHAESNLVRVAGELFAAGLAYVLGLMTTAFVVRQYPAGAEIWRWRTSELSKETL